MSIDFASVIRAALDAADHLHAEPTAVLAAKVPDLCPDCNGTGKTWPLENCAVDCTHPNAPSIGMLLNLASSRWELDKILSPAVWRSEDGRYFCHAEGHRMNSYDVAANKCWYCSNTMQIAGDET